MLFSGPDNPQKLPIPLEDLDFHLLHGSLSPCKNKPHANGISIGSAVFAALANVTNRQTDTHTDHFTASVAKAASGYCCDAA